jgi:ABC-type transport system substrate-binding protein
MASATYWTRLMAERLQRRTLLRRGAGAGVGSAAALLLACGRGTDKETEDEVPVFSGQTTAAATAAAEPAKRGGTLRAITSTDDPRFDPATITTSSGFPASLLYDRLIETNADGKMVPGLAERWETPEQTTVRLALRKGVKFHDGTDFNAEAVAFNIRRHQDPKTASGSRSDVELIDRVETPDGSTVVLRLKEPFSPQLEALTQAAGLIASPTALGTKAVQDANRAPVGTGPFKLKLWEPTVKTQYTRNEAYWQPDRPYLDGVDSLVIPTLATQVANLESGNAEYVRPETMDDAERLKNAGYQLIEAYTGGYTALRINHKAQPYTDIRFRQALAHSVDRRAVAQLVRTGTPVGEGIIGPAFKGVGIYDPNFKSPYEHDPAKAKALLAQAGAPNGFEFELCQGSSPALAAPVQLMQQQMKQAGINAQIWTAGNQLALVAQRLYASDFTVFYTSNVPNPAAPYFRIDAAVMTGASRNYEQYSNARIDQLLRDSWKQYNQAERLKVYREVERLLMDDAYQVVTEYLIERIASPKKVRGLVYYASNGGSKLTDVWLA